MQLDLYFGDSVRVDSTKQCRGVVVRVRNLHVLGACKEEMTCVFCTYSPNYFCLLVQRLLSLLGCSYDSIVCSSSSWRRSSSANSSALWWARKILVSKSCNDWMLCLSLLQESAAYTLNRLRPPFGGVAMSTMTAARQLIQHLPAFRGRYSSVPCNMYHILTSTCRVFSHGPTLCHGSAVEVAELAKMKYGHRRHSIQMCKL